MKRRRTTAAGIERDGKSDLPLKTRRCLRVVQSPIVSPPLVSSSSSSSLAVAAPTALLAAVKSCSRCRSRLGDDRYRNGVGVNRMLPNLWIDALSMLGPIEWHCNRMAGTCKLFSDMQRQWRFQELLYRHVDLGTLVSRAQSNLFSHIYARALLHMTHLILTPSFLEACSDIFNRAFTVPCSKLTVVAVVGDDVTADSNEVASALLYIADNLTVPGNRQLLFKMSEVWFRQVQWQRTVRKYATFWNLRDSSNINFHIENRFETARCLLHSGMRTDGKNAECRHWLFICPCTAPHTKCVFHGDPPDMTLNKRGKGPLAYFKGHETLHHPDCWVTAEYIEYRRVQTLRAKHAYRKVRNRLPPTTPAARAHLLNIARSQQQQHQLTPLSHDDDDHGDHGDHDEEEEEKEENEDGESWFG